MNVGVGGRGERLYEGMVPPGDRVIMVVNVGEESVGVGGSGDNK